ncbi:MAG: DnaJ domain-containing protein [Gammaproteobacteria bacterium]|nr:DnaJ domain-containing protein [Gammaproteobacteria bacterium]
MSNTRLDLKAARTIFNIDAHASMDEIKKKYKELAKTFHPDRNHASNATEKFQSIQNAYDLLLATKNKDPHFSSSNNSDQQNDVINKQNQKEKLSKNINQKLKIAVERNALGDVRKLLQAGANPNSGWGFYSSPLQHAITHGFFDVATLLLQKGANPDSLAYRDVSYRFTSEYTILHWICIHGIENNILDTDMVKLLLQFGANPNAQNGSSSILKDIASTHQWASLDNRRKQLEIIHLLLQFGADLNAKNKSGMTPLECGIYNPDPLTAQLFRSLSIKQAATSWLALLQAVRLLGVANSISSHLLQHINSFLPVPFSKEQQAKEKTFFNNIVDKNNQILLARKNGFFSPQSNQPNNNNKNNYSVNSKLKMKR